MNCTTPCSGCALSEGADANREPNNHLKAMIAVMGPVTFYCHDVMPWQESLTHMMSARLLKRLGQLRVCAGWRREVAVLAATGYYKGMSKTTRAVAACAIRALDKFLTDGVSAAEKEEAREDLRMYLEILTERKREFLSKEKPE